MFSVPNSYVTSLVGLLVVLSSAVSADHPVIEELLVTDYQDRRQVDVAETVDITPDSAALLRRAPGANVNGNGPLTGIPQYRGMFGPRINVEVNGTTLSSGGPNWMDPPLSYAPAAQLESLEVYRGIAPVSAGQETIGGAINAKTWSGDFSTSEEVKTSGRIRLGAQSVNEASLVSAAVVVANTRHRLKVSALQEQANDADFDGGKIQPSEYERERFDLGYGYRSGNHVVQIDVGRNETGDSGTPALPMDILYIDSDLASLRYHFEKNDRVIDARFFYSNIDHGMTNFLLRTAPPSPAMFRRNIASGDNLGFKLSTRWDDEHGSWTLGIDGHNEDHNSTIDNPNNPNFVVTNFNNAEREIVGLFAERKQALNKNAWLELGLRYNRVEMDAGAVDGAPATMPPGRALRDNFNAAQRQQADDNVDWVAKYYLKHNDSSTYYIGLARKSRSASYQERYLWLPLEATAGLADGRTYVGNINLEAEVAHEFELGLDYKKRALQLSPRIFYREVNDFIQGTANTNVPATMLVSMMNMMNGTNNAEPLQFNNVDATFYGFDMDWSYQLNESWSLNGVVNYVRGERDDVDDNLYRIAPLNTTIAVNYQSSSWGVTAESVLYAKQNKVSAINTEQKTSGYGLFNVKGFYQFTNNLRLGFGVDNVLDKEYSDHLGGYNRVRSVDVSTGERLPAYGRNVFARLDYQW